MSRQAVDFIYDAVFDDEAYGLVPSIIARDLAASAVVITEFDFDFRPRSVLFANYSAEMNQFYLDNNIAAIDAWSPLAAEKALWDRAVDCETLVSAEAFIKTPFYNEFFRRFGVDTARCLGAVLRKPNGLLAVGLHRGLRDAPFRPGETAELAALLPHLKRLSLLRERFGEMETRLKLHKGALDLVPYGIVVVDSGGRIQLINTRAEEIAARFPSLSITRRRLAAADARQNAVLQALITSAAQRMGSHGGAYRLKQAGSTLAVKLVITPMPLCGGAALVLLNDQARPKTALAPVLTQLYGFTPAEAELAVLLAQGLSTAEAAERREVSVATVRTQIKQLLAKTESRRLSDLTRLLALDNLLSPHSVDD